MKKLFYFIISATVLVSAIYGCKKPESGEDTLPPEISVKEPASYPNNEDTYSISYTIKNPVEGVILEVYSEDEWIVDLEADEEEIWFTLLENEKEKDRKGTIELTYEGAEPVDLLIKQKGNRPEITASKPEDFSASGGPGTITYSVKNPIKGADLKASSEDAWITGIAVTDKEVTFTVGANLSDEARTGKIKLEYEKADPLEVRIKQSGKGSSGGGSGEDLGANGTANSYIVTNAGEYKFATVKGNGSESVGEVASAEVLWETFGTDTAPAKGDLISEVSYENNYVEFKTNTAFKKGNAVIAAKDASGKILWSWHIWMTDKPEDQVYKNDAGIMMDRNLGATSATPGDVGALGLLYQWGRKDPFLGASSINEGTTAKAESTLDWPEPAESSESTGNIEYATEYPTTFIRGTSHWCEPEDYALWQSPKTIYDPCPPGYKVPGGDEGDDPWSEVFGSSVNGVYDETNRGMDFGLYSANRNLTESLVCWYPSTGYLSGGSLYGVGLSGKYWSNNIMYTGSDVLVFSIYTSGSVTTRMDSDFGNAYPVRCQKE